MKIGNQIFNTKTETYIMGILNATPDSFSDGGKYDTVDAALARVEEMISEGAHIIDIGGESARPGAAHIPAQEEIARVVPLITEIKKRFEIPVSLDTCKAEVAKAGIDAGIDMINDIWGLQYDEDMAGVIASSNLPCCLMHNKKEAVYNNFMTDVINEMEQMLEKAQEAGISYNQIIIDPGVGFSKSYEQDLAVINQLEKLHCFGLPIMLAASRKSVIGKTLDLDVDDRVEGTLATTVIGVMKNVGFVRVHDVRQNARAVKMALAVKNS